MVYVYKAKNLFRKGDKMKKATKKLISFALAAILVLSTFMVSAYAAPVTLAVSVDKESCLQGDSIVATIYFPGIYDKAAALDVELNYDKSKLEVVKTEKGVGLTKALNEQLNGKVFSENSSVPGKISWVLAGSNNFNFSGVFAVVTFKVRNTAVNGETLLDLNITSAANSGYVDITDQVVTKDAKVDIIRNSVNDFVFELNAEKTGYVVTAYRCATVDDLTIPSYHKNLPVVGIADKVFYNHGELKKVALPEHLRFIGDQAFYACTNLEGIEIPDTVETIGESAFLNCNALLSVKLPLGLKEIKDNTFYSCYFLENVEIPFTVEKIGRNAFYNCLSLRSVKISKNTDDIGAYAFGECYSDGIEFTTVEGNTYLPELIEADYPTATIKLVEDLSLGQVSSVQEKIEYTGAPIVPEVSVTLDNEAVVKDGDDYKVVYIDNVNLGKAKIYVVGINGYGEGYAIDFEIFCDHASVKRVVTQKPTCTVNGIYSCKCNHCGLVFEEEIEAKGHPEGEWIYDKRPSYDKTGIKHKVCTVCGGKYELNTVAEKVVPDINGDGNINSSDALLILQTAVGSAVYVSPEGLFNSDANGDTKINSSDALIVLQISVGKIKL